LGHLVVVLRHLIEFPVLVIGRGLGFLVALSERRTVLPLLLIGAAISWLVLCAAVAFVVAPIAGWLGSGLIDERISFFERTSHGIEIFDAKAFNVGIFNPLLDPAFVPGRAPIVMPDGRLEYPDHKSLTTSKVPPEFWRCVKHLEDRHLGSWRNPFGVDFVRLLAMPVSRRGSSTLAMQFARTYWKTLPRSDEPASAQLRRKWSELFLGPAIHQRLAKIPHGYEQWAADHLPMIQRDGSDGLYGIGFASQLLFGRPATELAEDTSARSIAQQFILAAAINQPVPVLKGSTPRQEEIRAGVWRRVVGVRAQKCNRDLLGKRLLESANVASILATLAKTPPATSSDAREVNPWRRATTYALGVQFGAASEMRALLGSDWQVKIGRLDLTLDVKANHRLSQRFRVELRRLNTLLKAKFVAPFQLIANDGPADRKLNDNPGVDNANPPASSAKFPDVVVAAMTLDGKLVRYFEAGGERAAFFGSALAQTPEGTYDPTREGRPVASVGKLLAAIALARAGETANANYSSARACRWPCSENTPGATCPATALSAFARSTNAPILSRLVKQELAADLASIAETLGFNAPGHATPMPTATVCGYLGASPRIVLRTGAVILSAMKGQLDREVPLPSLVGGLQDVTGAGVDLAPLRLKTRAVSPSQLGITRAQLPFLEAVLSAPICGVTASDGSRTEGTLRRLADWCAASRPTLQRHFGKTGTHDSAGGTSEAWTAGGIEFRNGASYAYVVLIGTGNPKDPWARGVNAGQVTTPLLSLLLADLEAESGILQSDR
jgi:penicillin-binding protein 1A